MAIFSRRSITHQIPPVPVIGASAPLDTTDFIVMASPTATPLPLLQASSIWQQAVLAGLTGQPSQTLWVTPVLATLTRLPPLVSSLIVQSPVASAAASPVWVPTPIIVTPRAGSIPASSVVNAPWLATQPAPTWTPTPPVSSSLVPVPGGSLIQQGAILAGPTGQPPVTVWAPSTPQATSTPLRPGSSSTINAPWLVQQASPAWTPTVPAAQTPTTPPAASSIQQAGVLAGLTGQPAQTIFVPGAAWIPTRSPQSNPSLIQQAGILGPSIPVWVPLIQAVTLRLGVVGASSTINAAWLVAVTVNSWAPPLVVGAPTPPNPIQQSSIQQSGVLAAPTGQPAQTLHVPQTPQSRLPSVSPQASSVLLPLSQPQPVTPVWAPMPVGSATPAATAPFVSVLIFPPLTPPSAPAAVWVPLAPTSSIPQAQKLQLSTAQTPLVAAFWVPPLLSSPTPRGRVETAWNPRTRTDQSQFILWVSPGAFDSRWVTTSDPSSSPFGAAFDSTAPTHDTASTPGGNSFDTPAPILR